jgi:hypothetical protein
MGYDARCTLRFEGRTVSGTAWLEHKDLVFRGPERLAIPLAKITTAKAVGDVLDVRFGRKQAEFEIGKDAAKWASRIANPPSRLDKLGIKPGHAIALLNVDDEEFSAELSGRGATVKVPGPVAAAKLRDMDVIFFGAGHTSALGHLAALSGSIKPAGAIWVIRPKGQKSITEADTMAAGKRAGLVDVKVVSFSDTYTAEKFVIPVASRPVGAAGGKTLQQRGASAPRRR